MRAPAGLVLLSFSCFGCGVALDFDPADDLGGHPHDAAVADAGVPDDSGFLPRDAGPPDGNLVSDAGFRDAAVALDASVPRDASLVVDASVPVDAFVPECILDTDCPSPDLCTVGRCLGGTCLYGMPVCDDFDPCTNDGCTAATGMCFHRPVSCDDGVSCTADACDSASGSCSNTRIDADDDGQSPATLGACGMDCNDMNSAVHVGEPAWFTAPYTTPMGTSFDYDCSGHADLEYTTFSLGPCMFVASGPTCPTPGGCCTGSGWNFSGTSMLPTCGMMGTYHECAVTGAGGSCTMILHDAFVQGCH